MHADKPGQQIHWNAYPAVLLAVSLGAGIVAADRFPALTFSGWFILAAPGVALASFELIRARYCPYRVAPLSRNIAIVLLAFSVGAISFRLAQTPARDLFERLLGAAESYEDITFTGRVMERPSRGATTERFVLSVRSVASGRVAYRATGRLLVVLRSPAPDSVVHFPEVTQGDVLRLTGRLRPIDPPRNPAEFDYRRYLSLQRIHHRFTITSPDDITRLAPERNVLEAFVLAAQRHALAVFDAHIGGERERTLVSALVLGDRSVMDDDTRDDFRRTGLTHLLAISGAHMVVIGLVLYRLLGPLLTRFGVRWRTMETVRFVVTAVVLVFYTLLTGASASAVRAAVMIILFMGGALLQRSSPPMNTLGVAAVVLLAMEPAALYDLGFQLSFAAVAGLILLHPVFMELVPELWRALAPVRAGLTAVSVSLAATVATAPILLSHFGYVSLAGLALNIAAVPLSGLLLISGVATVLCEPALPFPAELFGSASEGMARVMLFIAWFGDDTLSWATVRFELQTAWAVAALCTGILTATARPYRVLRRRLAIVTLLLAAGTLWSGLLEGSTRPRLNIVFFDVGQGDAALVTMPSGRRLLVDAGLRSQWSDAGERVVLPHLERYGIHHLDAVLITHPHSDHLGGLPAVLRSIPVHRVIHSGDTHDSRLYTEAKQLIDSLHIVEKHVRIGDTLRLDPDVHVSILSPTSDTVEGEDLNAASVVVRIGYGATTFLLMGDADAEAERQLIHRYGPLLRSDVIKVGHHGSSTSSDPAFIMHVFPDTTSPTSAIVSVARSNVYGLPDSSVLARWSDRGARVWTTASEGAVWLASDGDSVRRVHWR